MAGPARTRRAVAWRWWRRRLPVGEMLLAHPGLLAERLPLVQELQRHLQERDLVARVGAPADVPLRERCFPAVVHRLNAGLTKRLSRYAVAASLDQRAADERCMRARHLGLRAASRRRAEDCPHARPVENSSAPCSRARLLMFRRDELDPFVAGSALRRLLIEKVNS